MFSKMAQLNAKLDPEIGCVNKPKGLLTQVRFCIKPGGLLKNKIIMFSKLSQLIAKSDPEIECVNEAIDQWFVHPQMSTDFSGLSPQVLLK